jgi:catechol 2,3-dioxygenase-like lactoylglutathione lyase family enzyme
VSVANGERSRAIGGIRAVDYTVLICSHLHETKAFYRDVMGFDLETDRETWVDFRLGDQRLSLRPRGAFVLNDDGPRQSGSAAVQLAFQVDLVEIDRCHETLLARGVPILRGPTDLPQWRHRTLFFKDPEDNVLEIYARY